MATTYTVTYDLSVVFTENAKTTYGFTDIGWEGYQLQVPYGNPGWGGLFSPTGVVSLNVESQSWHDQTQNAEAQALVVAMLDAHVAAWNDTVVQGSAIVSSASYVLHRIDRVDDTQTTTTIYSS